jgi:hypothetical protein
MGLWCGQLHKRTEKGKKVNIITDAELADSYGKIRVCDLVFSINQTEQEFDQGQRSTLSYEV